MFLITCPYCGEARAEDEFQAAGEAGIVRPAEPMNCSDEEWGEYLHFRRNPRGAHRELWVHAAGCGKVFEVRRDTVDYRIHETLPLAGAIDAEAS